MSIQSHELYAFKVSLNLILSSIQPKYEFSGDTLGSLQQTIYLFLKKCFKVFYSLVLYYLAIVQEWRFERQMKTNWGSC